MYNLSDKNISKMLEKNKYERNEQEIVWLLGKEKKPFFKIVKVNFIVLVLGRANGKK